MVGRFVHEQDVRPPEQHARHGDAHLPAARECADIAVDLLVGEAEPVQDFARLAFERVAAEMFVLFLHFSEPVQDLLHVVGPRRIGHRLVQFFEFMMQVTDAPAPGNRLVDHGSSRHLLDVLPEVTDRQLLRHRHFAIVRRFLADDHAEEGGLAGAVRTDQSDLLPRIQLERGVDEQDLTAVLLVDAIERNHGSPTSVSVLSA